ncbi:hypothetical protein JCGZ_10009 [Jatropha curcas]|uniref:Uncharacterized protein n=1 Tax=Jatropha curcas TaxID=180498 RepID=A0A067KM00_JATCU|nr:hypothetical protein JCGZ_10009 [Jatropha curcas]
MPWTVPYSMPNAKPLARLCEVSDFRYAGKTCARPEPCHPTRPCPLLPGLPEACTPSAVLLRTAVPGKSDFNLQERCAHALGHAKAHAHARMHLDFQRIARFHPCYSARPCKVNDISSAGRMHARPCPLIPGLLEACTPQPVSFARPCALSNRLPGERMVQTVLNHMAVRAILFKKHALALCHFQLHALAASCIFSPPLSFSLVFSPKQA